MCNNSTGVQGVTIMPDSRKILHIINGDYYAGAERVQDLLALALPELGYEVGFVCLKKGLFAEKRASKNVELYEFPMRTRLDIGFIFKLSKLATSQGYQLVHTHSTRAALVGRLVSRIAGLPMVHHLHSPTADDTETGWRNRRNSFAEKLALSRAKMIIPVSGTLQDYILARGFGRERIRVVHNGVPLRSKLRKVRDPSTPFVVGMVALFRPRKGLEILLDALAKLRQEGIPIRLHAVGPFETNQYHDHIMKMTQELGLTDSIIWTGFSGDVFAEFGKMNAFVLPSLYGEGMPMVILEAMSVGLPVVSTKVEGIPEIIRSGTDGLLVESGNADELAGAIGAIVTGAVDGDLLGDSGWQRQRESFSDRSMAKQVADIYGAVLSPEPVQ
jgi:glycosyltransferase involved in cell wall biosynthesis